MKPSFLAHHPKPARARHGGRGFTIVEILVALVFLSLAAGGAYTHFANLNSATAERSSAIRARLLAHQRLAELLVAPYDELAAWTPPTEPRPLAGSNFHELIAVEPRGADTLTVDVRVGWSVDAGAFAPGASSSARGVATR